MVGQLVESSAERMAEPTADWKVEHWAAKTAARWAVRLADRKVALTADWKAARKVGRTAAPWVATRAEPMAVQMAEH